MIIVGFDTLIHNSFVYYFKEMSIKCQKLTENSNPEVIKQVFNSFDCFKQLKQIHFGPDFDPEVYETMNQNFMS